MKVWQYGDDINTDMLFPGRYTYTCSTAEEILPHLLEDLDSQFAVEAKAGDLILAGKNFGCGSSREQPALGFQALGLQAIVAVSFSRIFYRAAVNQGLNLIESSEAVKAYRPGNTIVIDHENGALRLEQQVFRFPPLPPEILGIREAGGLLPYVRRKLEMRRRDNPHG